MKRIGAILAGVLMCSLVWGLVTIPRAGAQRSAVTKPPARVESSSPITLTRCRIKLRDQFTLAFDQPGILAFVEPEEGDRVRAGQEVAGLNDEVPQAMYDVAQKKAENDIQPRFARKAADVAQAELLSAMETNRQVPGTVPDIEVQRLKLAWEKSQLSIELADDEFLISGLEAKEAQARLDMYRLKAPFDGVVTQVYKRKGEAVRQGDPILEMANTDRVRVEGRVAMTDVWKVKASTPVRVQLQIPEVDLPEEHRIFNGRVVFVDVAVQPVTREVRVWAEVTNDGNILKDGLTATMTIDIPRKLAEASNP